MEPHVVPPLPCMAIWFEVAFWLVAFWCECNLRWCYFTKRRGGRTINASLLDLKQVSEEEKCRIIWWEKSRESFIIRQTTWNALLLPQALPQWLERVAVGDYVGVALSPMLELSFKLQLFIPFMINGKRGYGLVAATTGIPLPFFSLWLINSRIVVIRCFRL